MTGYGTLETYRITKEKQILATGLTLVDTLNLLDEYFLGDQITTATIKVTCEQTGRIGLGIYSVVI